MAPETYVTSHAPYVIINTCIQCPMVLWTNIIQLKIFAWYKFSQFSQMKYTPQKKTTKMKIDDVIMCIRQCELVVSTRMVLYSLSALKIVTVEIEESACYYTNESVRDAPKLSKLRSAVPNFSVQQASFYPMIAVLTPS